MQKYINSVLKFWSNSILKVYNDRKETLHCDGACALKREPFAFYLQSGHSSSALHLGPSLFCRTRLRLSCMQKFCIYNKPQISYKVSRLIIWKVLVKLFEFIKYEPFFRSHGNFIVISHKHYSFAYQQSYVIFGSKLSVIEESAVVWLSVPTMKWQLSNNTRSTKPTRECNLNCMVFCFLLHVFVIS